MNRLEQKFDDLRAEVNEVKVKLKHQNEYIEYFEDSLSQTALKADLYEREIRKTRKTLPQG